MKVTVCSICKQEEDFIRPWVEHLLDLDCIDRILLYDGGSTDKTIEYLSQYGDKVCYVEGEDFNDFSEARNANLATAKASSEWILCLDIDELFTAGYQDLFAMMEDMDLSQYEVIRFPHIKFYDFNKLWFHTPPTTPCIHADGVVEYSIYKDTIALWRPATIGKFSGSLHERLETHDHMPQSKLISLKKAVRILSADDLIGDVVVGHYSKAKLYAESRRTGKSFEYCVGKKRAAYRKIKPLTYFGTLYDAEWVDKADEGDLEQLGRDQMKQFIEVEGHIFPKTSFDPYDMNNEFVQKYFPKESL